jgi:Tfp pilus assembly protein PilF
MGVVLFRAKDDTGARAALARALAIDPKARWARYNRALVEESAGNVPAAIAEYRAEIESYPDAYKALFNLGRLLAKTGDRAGAADAFRKAVEAQPDWGIGRFFLARTLLESGDLEGAKTEALKGLDLDARSEFAALGHYVLADVYERQGQRALAASEVSKAKAIERK